ncbi:hypothetical protein ACJX0J_036411, partial [Zea mays]
MTSSSLFYACAMTRKFDIIVNITNCFNNGEGQESHLILICDSASPLFLELQIVTYHAAQQKVLKLPISHFILLSCLGLNIFLIFSSLLLQYNLNLILQEKKIEQKLPTKILILESLLAFELPIPLFLGLKLVLIQCLVAEFVLNNDVHLIELQANKSNLHIQVHDPLLPFFLLSVVLLDYWKKYLFKTKKTQ